MENVKHERPVAKPPPNYRLPAVAIEEKRCIFSNHSLQRL